MKRTKKNAKNNCIISLSPHLWVVGNTVDKNPAQTFGKQALARRMNPDLLTGENYGCGIFCGELYANSGPKMA